MQESHTWLSSSRRPNHAPGHTLAGQQLASSIPCARARARRRGVRGGEEGHMHARPCIPIEPRPRRRARTLPAVGNAKRPAGELDANARALLLHLARLAILLRIHGSIGSRQPPAELAGRCPALACMAAVTTPAMCVTSRPHTPTCYVRLSRLIKGCCSDRSEINLATRLDLSSTVPVP